METDTEMIEIMELAEKKFETALMKGCKGEIKPEEKKNQIHYKDPNGNDISENDEIAPTAHPSTETLKNHHTLSESLLLKLR